MNIAARLDTAKVHPVDVRGGMNTPDEVILDQVRQNIRRGLPQAQPHEIHPAMALLVCGGPSLPMTEKELVRSHWAGGKIIAVNGAYRWCIEHNLKPSAAVMLDAREFNARFIEEPVEGCRYLIASQCHPRAFEMCRDRNVTIWHACSVGDPEVALLREFYFEPETDPAKGFRNVHPVTLGTTVGVRAMSLFRMLGFTHFEVYGLDSCWLGDEHHAYAQPENSDKRISMWLRPKGEDDKHRDDKAMRFECAPWHMKQAQDFMRLIRERGDHFQMIDVKGPGLIASIMRTGAEIQMESGQ